MFEFLKFLVQPCALPSAFPVKSLRSYDAAANVAVIEYKGDTLVIDASLLPEFQFRVDSLYQFIGEVQVMYFFNPLATHPD